MLLQNTKNVDIR